MDHSLVVHSPSLNNKVTVVVFMFASTASCLILYVLTQVTVRTMRSDVMRLARATHSTICKSQRAVARKAWHRRSTSVRLWTSSLGRTIKEYRTHITFVGVENKGILLHTVPTDGIYAVV